MQAPGPGKTQYKAVKDGEYKAATPRDREETEHAEANYHGPERNGPRPTGVGVTRTTRNP